MPLTNITHNQLQDIIAQLDQALYNHKEWYRLLIRTLVCRLPGDKHDLLPEAHTECRFGQWYHTYADKNLLENPGFIAIGEEHKRMHQLTTLLLTASDVGNPISTYDYDNFANSIERLQLEIFALKRELEELVYNRDPLTGAINRLDMLSILREHQALVKRQVYKFCYLVMMDIDHFSKVNNAYGHAAGDKVLATTVHYVIESLRPYDKVFRYGGEEFLLLLQDIELSAARELIERLRNGLANLSIDAGQEKPVHITACFGLALLNPSLPIEQSIDHADKAVYEAKSAGRDCVKIWDEKQS